MDDRASSTKRGRWRWYAIGLLVVSMIVGCVQLRDLTSQPAPDVVEWRPLLEELRRFERRIGFRDTRNFASLSEERESYPFCGRASSHHLPYSYEDPAISWLESITEEQCRDVGSDTDAYFEVVEAWGEIGTPVTSSMVAGKLDRFIYLVIHEDCHDQFQLPYGIEEALCDIITYRAMAAFGTEKFGWYTLENRAIKHYTRVQSRQTRETIAYYAQLEKLYARYQRAEIPIEKVLEERAGVFAHAERTLDMEEGQLNNINLASLMTYSRHYPYLEGVTDRLGHDLACIVAFFREVDERKPSPAEIMQRHKITNRKSVEFVRANETATIRTIGELLNRRTAALR